MSIKNVTRETLLGLLSQVRDNLKAGLAPKEWIIACYEGLLFKYTEWLRTHLERLFDKFGGK